jgi:hypothetical protein
MTGLLLSHVLVHSKLLFPQQSSLTTVIPLGTPWALEAAHKALFSNYSSSLKSRLVNSSAFKNEDMKIPGC